MSLVPEHSVHYVEYVTTEPDKLRDACAKTFGWRFEQMGPELGGSWVAELPGGGLCGIRAPMHDQEKPVTRTYMRVADIARATELARANGAFVALPPMSVGKHGTISIHMLGGIEQGLWQVA